MAEAQIYLNDNYTADTSTKTVVQYVELTIEAAKSDIIQDIRPEIDNLVDESLSEKMGRYSLTNHSHDSYATKDELSHYSLTSHTHDYALSSEVYNKQEVDLKIETHVPDLTSYATKDELQNYSTVSHQHSDYALADEVYTKNETENLVNSHVPDLSSYYTKNETLDLISNFKPVEYLTTQQYEELESKDPSTLYVLTDSTEDEIDLSQYVTKEELELKNYKSILYITTQQYLELESKDPSTLYVLTDSTEDPVDLTDYYTKSLTDNLISNFKPIQYLTTQLYEELESKDENTLYVLTDSQEEAIDLSQFSLTNHIHADYVLNSSLSDNYYNKSYIDTSLNDVYTKTQTDEKLAEKANICVLDIYSILNGDVTEDMWNEWIDCIENGGIFYQDNGDKRTTLEVTNARDDNKEINQISFIVVDTRGYSYLLNISKKDDGRGISFNVESNEFNTVYNIDNLNEWDDSKWDYVTLNLGSVVFVSGGFPLSINYDDDNRLFISTVEEGVVRVYTVTREASRSLGNYIYTVTEAEQYEVEDIDDLNTWNDEKWNLVSQNSNGASLFTYNNNPLNVSENKEGQLLLSYLAYGTTLRVFTVTREASRKPASYTYTVESNNFYLADLENFYTKDYIDTSLNNVYTKSEIDTMIGDIETSLASI